MNTEKFDPTLLGANVRDPVSGDYTGAVPRDWRGNPRQPEIDPDEARYYLQWMKNVLEKYYPNERPNRSKRA